MKESVPVLPMCRLSVLIKGPRVQGIGYRQYVWEQARAQPGITGYVRNTRDGHVEVVAEGPADALREFLSRIAKGPSGARVTSVETEWSAAEGGFGRFEIRF